MELDATSHVHQSHAVSILHMLLDGGAYVRRCRGCGNLYAYVGIAGDLYRLCMSGGFANLNLQRCVW